MPTTRSGLAPRYNRFGAAILQNARFVGEEEMPFTEGSILSVDELSATPFDHLSDKSFPPGEWLHFYVHDVRFLHFLESPDAFLRRIRRFAGVIGMDNSVSYDMPLVEQKHSVYLNRVSDHWLWLRRIPFVPNVSWGDSRSFHWCFAGIDPGKTVAVSTHGCIGTAADKFRFLDGLAAMVSALHPPSVVAHGRLFPAAAALLSEAGIRIIPLRSRMERHLSRKEAARGQK